MNETLTGAGARPTPRRTSLAQQLLMLAVLPALVVAVAVIAVLARQHLASVTELTRVNAQAVAAQVATLAQVPLEQMDRRALVRTASAGAHQPQVLRVQIWTEDGEILANAQSDNEAANQANDQSMRATAPILDAQRRQVGQAMVEVSLEAIRRARANTLLNVALLVAAGVLGVGLSGAWAARRIGAPIRELGEALDRLAAGEAVSVAVEGPAEIGKLQAGFNEAARALNESRRLLESRVVEATAELAHKNQLLESAGQAKTRLLAAASHDLRQPLHALTLFSDALQKGESDPVRIRHIGHMRECVAALDRLFSELLNLSQLDAGVLRPQPGVLALDQLFTEVSRNFRPVAEERDLRLVVRPTDLFVHSDFLMLSRILNNLISNALRHTRSGGVLLAARRFGDRVRIEVMDTGSGIEPRHQLRVFEEFYQVDQDQAHGTRGLGLGLATVRRLADLLGLTVQLQSVPGRGTRVSVIVARSDAVHQATPAAAQSNLVPDAAAFSFDDLSILVIDDEPIILEGLELLLGMWGSQVLTALDPDQAMALAHQWEEPPDIVMCDLLLRDGESGIALLRRLAPHLGGAACLLVTGETDPARLREIASAGVTVLHKPVAPGALRAAIVKEVLAARAVSSTRG